MLWIFLKPYKVHSSKQGVRGPGVNRHQGGLLSCPHGPTPGLPGSLTTADRQPENGSKTELVPSVKD